MPGIIETIADVPVLAEAFSKMLTRRIIRTKMEEARRRHERVVPKVVRLRRLRKSIEKRAGAIDRILSFRATPELAAVVLGSLGIRAAGKVLHDKIREEGIDIVEREIPVPYKKEKVTAPLAGYIEDYRKKYNLTDVPVYAGGKMDTSMIVPEYASAEMIELARKTLNAKGPGIYLKQSSPGIALHELGHAREIREQPTVSKIPAISGVLGGAATLSGLISKSTKGKMIAALLAGGFMTPALISEYKASAKAKEYLKEYAESKGEEADRAKELDYALGTYVAGAATPPAIIAGSALIRKLIKARLK
jgi:hypothetical protein